MTGATSVHAAFSAACANYAEHPFLYVPPAVAARYAVAAGEITYADMLSEVARLAEHYYHAGYGGGHRIGLMLDNRPAFIAHWFALNALGVSVVPINAELSAVEQAYLMQLSGVCLVLFADEHNATLGDAIDALGAPLSVLALDDIRLLPRAPSARSDVDIDAATECAILFTSGSTGQAKACLLSNAYFLEMGAWYRDLGGSCALESGVERLLTPLPLTHMNAMATSLMAMVMTGGCLIQLDRFHPQSWWRVVNESRASVIHYLGVMPAILLQLEASEFERNPSIKFGFGAGINPAHHAAFEERFGFPLIEGWAMTETGAGGCIVANREPRHVGRSCFGKPDPTRVAFRLVDEAGDDVASGEPGELLVRAVGKDPRKGYFGGYYRNDAATNEGWADEWWHTGDVVRQIEDGSLCFVDRRKNIIRRSGENIAALEVEAVLSRHAAPKALAVTAAPDDIRGEEVMACIVLEDAYPPCEETAVELFEHCRGSLAYFKLPGYVVFVDSLPLTATQKPKRNEIKALARNFVATAQTDVRIFDLRPRKRKQVA